MKKSITVAVMGVIAVMAVKAGAVELNGLKAGDVSGLAADMRIALPAGGSAMKTGAQPVEYVAKEQGKFMMVQGLAFCTHDKTNYGYSFELKETGYVNALFVLNKETGGIEKFDYKGWTDHGLLWDSRVFTLSKTNPDFPRVITLRNTRAGGNDVFHLSEYVDQDNYVIESKDPGFTVSSTAAYRNIFECTKK